MTKYEQMIEDAAALNLYGEDARKVEYVVTQYLNGRTDADVQMLAESIAYTLRGR